MTVFIPIWVLIIPIVYIGMGVLLLPVITVKIHHMMRHNQGWTWKNTLFGIRFNLFRFIFGIIATIVAWPLAMREVS